MNDSRIEDIISSGAETKGLELLANRSTVGSLSATDQFSSEELERFWLNSKNIQDSNITGCESFPGEMLKPITEKVLLTKEMLSLMVDYYIATYENYNFKTPFGEGPEGSIIISVTINRFGRCRIGSEIFGSTTSFRHIKNSFILAKFITDNGVDCYPGQVQYFFKHTIDLPEGLVDHNLAYVRWYQHAETSKTRFYFSIDDEEKTCNVELWKPEFYPESCDCIIPVHNILGRFVPLKYKISTRQNAIEYLAINPVNRKFNIR
jgi:hypothetical protein